MTDSNSSIFKTQYAALLFDMDGTLLSSLLAAERIWGAWAIRHGLDPVKFLPTIHGARSVDTVAKLGLPGVDPVHEANLITQAEIEDVAGLIEISGAAHFVKDLPQKKWAIVTSAPRALAIARLKAAGLRLPDVLITSESVTAGKPNPACYKLAAEKLGVDIKDCLIFEDAPIGIQAAEASGAKVLVVTSTHDHPMQTPHAKLKDYQKIKASVDAHGLVSIQMRD